MTLTLEMRKKQRPFWKREMFSSQVLKDLADYLKPFLVQ
jgi:hypothetical protein